MAEVQTQGDLLTQADHVYSYGIKLYLALMKNPGWQAKFREHIGTERKDVPSRLFDALLSTAREAPPQSTEFAYSTGAQFVFATHYQVTHEKVYQLASVRVRSTLEATHEKEFVDARHKATVEATDALLSDLGYNDPSRMITTGPEYIRVHKAIIEWIVLSDHFRGFGTAKHLQNMIKKGLYRAKQVTRCMMHGNVSTEIEWGDVTCLDYAQVAPDVKGILVKLGGCRMEQVRGMFQCRPDYVPMLYCLYHSRKGK